MALNILNSSIHIYSLSDIQGTAKRPDNFELNTTITLINIFIRTYIRVQMAFNKQ